MKDRERLEDIWERYYDGMEDEEGRVKFLLYLKRRRDLENDDAAGDFLIKLNGRWLRSRYDRP